MKSSQSISIKNNLTIVTPTYNESKYIEKTIKTLLKQRGIGEEMLNKLTERMPV